MTLSTRCAAFMRALAATDEEEFCAPPGLGGYYRVRWIRQGLKSGALTIHHSGRGLAVTCQQVGGDPRVVRVTEAAREWENAQAAEDELAPSPRKKAEQLALRSIGGKP